VIQLYINNELVDLCENPCISFSEESPVFEIDAMPGGFSLPFDIPNSARNNRILKHAGRIQSASFGILKAPFELFHDGRLIATGTAKMQKTSAQVYGLYLQVGTGDFAGKTEGKKLMDVDFGGVREWFFKPEFTFPDDDFALFPVYNPKFMDDTQFKDQFIANGYRISAYGNGAYYTEPGMVSAVTPFPFLAYVLERIFNHFGFVVKENIFATDAELRKLVVYSNHEAGHMTWTAVHERRWEVDMTTGSYHYRYYWVITFDRVLETWNLADQLPDMLIKDFVLAVRSMFNTAITIDHQGYVSIARRKDLVSTGKATTLTPSGIRNPTSCHC
jgi:hypothetical protein